MSIKPKEIYTLKTNKMTKINKIHITNINLMCWMMFSAKMKLLWVNERGPAGRSLDSELRLLLALQRLHPAACFCLNHWETFVWTAGHDWMHYLPTEAASVLFSLVRDNESGILCTNSARSTKRKWVLTFCGRGWGEEALEGRWEMEVGGQQRTGENGQHLMRPRGMPKSNIYFSWGAEVNFFNY